MTNSMIARLLIAVISNLQCPVFSAPHISKAEVALLEKPPPLGALLPPKQLQQPHDIHRNPPRLIFAERLGR